MLFNRLPWSPNSAKNEERKRKEEEKQKEETLTVKTKMQFESYFIKKEIRNKDQEQAAAFKSSRFMPFQLKGNMSLASTIRRTDCLNMNDEQRAEFIAKLDKELRLGDDATEPAEPFKGLSYLDEIRKNPNLIRKQTLGCRRR